MGGWVEGSTAGENRPRCVPKNKDLVPTHSRPTCGNEKLDPGVSIGVSEKVFEVFDRSRANLLARLTAPRRPDGLRKSMTQSSCRWLPQRPAKQPHICTCNEGAQF